MKLLLILLATTLVTACGFTEKETALGVDSQDLAKTLSSYQASEWEPSWSLDLSDGRFIKFRQLDPVTGSDFVTDSYIVSKQTALQKGWTIQGEGPKGALTFTTLNVGADGGCSHSATGDIHRDQVTVTSPLKTWRGCGGPKL